MRDVVRSRGDKLVIVASDRVKRAFDWILSPPIPGKGRILTAMTLFWLKWLDVPNHLIGAELSALPREFQLPELEGRTMLVKKTTVFPVECVYAVISSGRCGRKYQTSRTACGIPLPAELPLASKLPQPIFTPATKAETGHDENISFGCGGETIAAKCVARELETKTLDVYRRAARSMRRVAGSFSRIRNSNGAGFPVAKSFSLTKC